MGSNPIFIASFKKPPQTKPALGPGRGKRRDYNSERKSMDVGRITFGPTMRPDAGIASGYRLQPAVNMTSAQSMPCNCIGAQPGETKCPCMLRAENAQGEAMIRNGVSINGRRYRLVPDGDETGG